MDNYDKKNDENQEENKEEDKDNNNLEGINFDENKFYFCLCCYDIANIRDIDTKHSKIRMSDYTFYAEKSVYYEVYDYNKKKQ